MPPSLESLKTQLKQLLILEYGNFSIYNHPQLYKDLTDHGLNAGDISRLVLNIGREINRKPYDIIDGELRDPILKGAISREQIDDIIRQIGDLLPAATGRSHIDDKITRAGFRPRETDGTPEARPILWMTDEAFKDQRDKVEVEWLSKKVTSLKQIADISFKDKELAKSHLTRPDYLVPLVVLLTKSSSIASDYEKIIKQETDPEKRFLRIVYRLNPKLPFLLRGASYSSVPELLENAFATHEGFEALQGSFSRRELQIWLEESHPRYAKSCPKENTYTAFLEFAYQTTPSLPFFIEKNLFRKPGDLAALVNDYPSWSLIGFAIRQGYLQQWFSGLGLTDWNDALNSAEDQFRATDFYDNDDIDRGMVRQLAALLSPENPEPFIETEPSLISLPSLEASSQVDFPITLRLHHPGYLKARISLFNAPKGVTLNRDIVLFNSFKERSEQQIMLSVAPSELNRDETYYFSTVITTVGSELVIPAEVSIAFPRKAYGLRLLVYACIGALIFGGSRYLLSLLLQDSSWITSLTEMPYPSTGLSVSALASLIILLIALWLAVKFIRRIEKI